MTAIEHLAATPDIFRALMTGVGEEQAYWKPGPGRFSIAELLEHLSHVEGHYFRALAERIVAEDDPRVEGYDTDAIFAAGTYAGRDAEESMAHWEDQREDNVEFLRGLDTAQFSRTARHPEAGRFTLENLVNEWALHDLGHIRQLAELVRAQLYYPGIGPFSVAVHRTALVSSRKTITINATMLQPIEFRPIGTVHSPVAEPSDNIWGGVQCRIELDSSRFTPDCLASLTDFSHVEIVFFFHRVPESEIETGTRHPRNRLDFPKVGIFAQRGRNRPNRLGVTICRLISVEGLSVEVVGLDAIDGTPVLDIKPYVKEFAARGEVRQPAWVDELMRGYWGSTYFG